MGGREWEGEREVGDDVVKACGHVNGPWWGILNRGERVLVPTVGILNRHSGPCISYVIGAINISDL